MTSSFQRNFHERYFGEKQKSKIHFPLKQKKNRVTIFSARDTRDSVTFDLPVPAFIHNSASFVPTSDDEIKFRNHPNILPQRLRDWAFGGHERTNGKFVFFFPLFFGIPGRTKSARTRNYVKSFSFFLLAERRREKEKRREYKIDDVLKEYPRRSFRQLYKILS